jgi:hypothetical protein
VQLPQDRPAALVLLSCAMAIGAVRPDWLVPPANIGAAIGDDGRAVVALAAQVTGLLARLTPGPSVAAAASAASSQLTIGPSLRRWVLGDMADDSGVYNEPARPKHRRPFRAPRRLDGGAAGGAAGGAVGGVATSTAGRGPTQPRHQRPLNAISDNQPRAHAGSARPANCGFPEGTLGQAPQVGLHRQDKRARSFPASWQRPTKSPRGDGR